MYMFYAYLKKFDKYIRPYLMQIKGNRDWIYKYTKRDLVMFTERLYIFFFFNTRTEIFFIQEKS